MNSIKQPRYIQSNASEKFTVLLAVYKKDDPDLFSKALESIFLNSLQPKELLIVADGELSNQLKEVIGCYENCQYLKFIQLPKNLGLAEALNVGLREINTEYTIRADADDFNYSNRFEQVIEKLDEGYDLVGSAIREVDKEGEFVAFRKSPKTEAEIKVFASKRNPFNHMTVGFRTRWVQKVGGYPAIYLKEDYALWATLLSIGCRACNLDVALVDATAGTEMFQRRSGLKYAIAEINLQTHLVQKKLKKPMGAFVHGVMRSAIFLAPNFIRQYVYIRHLRSNKI